MVVLMSRLWYVMVELHSFKNLKSIYLFSATLTITLMSKLIRPYMAGS